METDFIRFTGTGSAAASRERFHSSFVFYSGGKYCLMDAGDGISKALLTHNVPFNDIKSVIISHMHPDHYSGLAGLLIQMKLIKRKDELSLYIHESLKSTVLTFIKSSYLFPQRLGFTLQIKTYTSDNFFQPLNKLEVLARQNSHLDDYVKDSPGGLSFSCSSYLFNFNKQSVFYTGDIGSEEDLYLFNDHKIDIMISEVTHVDLSKVFNAFKLSGAAKLYLTHLSDGDELKINTLTANPGSPETAHKVALAVEGLQIPF